TPASRYGYAVYDDRVGKVCQKKVIGPRRNKGGLSIPRLLFPGTRHLYTNSFPRRWTDQTGRHSVWKTARLLFAGPENTTCKTSILPCQGIVSLCLGGLAARARAPWLLTLSMPKDSVVTSNLCQAMPASSWVNSRSLTLITWPDSRRP